MSMSYQRRSILGKLGGYRSAANQARMRQQDCKMRGDKEGTEKWRLKAEQWTQIVEELRAKLAALQ